VIGVVGRNCPSRNAQASRERAWFPNPSQFMLVVMAMIRASGGIQRRE
jgi:hypothetical protein